MTAKTPWLRYVCVCVCVSLRSRVGDGESRGVGGLFWLRNRGGISRLIRPSKQGEARKRPSPHLVLRLPIAGFRFPLGELKSLYGPAWLRWRPGTNQSPKFGSCDSSLAGRSDI